MDMRNVFSDFLKDVKKVVKENSNNKSDLLIGTVLSISPLQIQINVSEGSLILDKEFLTITTLVSDFVVDADIILGTGSEVRTEIGYGPQEHTHVIQGNKSKQTLKVYLGLKVGEKVLLVRVAQGQHYIVLDRLREQ